MSGQSTGSAGTAPTLTSHAVIALGANLGDRDATLRAAVAELGAVAGVRVVGASVPIESVALTVAGLDESKPAYLNGVVVVVTDLVPARLLDELNRIEDAHGRVREERWGDRTLDLDLIVYDGVTLDTERLTLPHPRAAERSFVLEPWAQVEPGAVLPGRGPIADLLAGLGDEVAHVPGAPALDVPLASSTPGSSR